MSRFLSRALVIGGLILTLGLCQSASVRAESLRQDTCLKFVPKSVALFSTSLRLREQWDAIAQSKAYQRLRELPLVKTGLEKLNQEWESDNDEGMAKLRGFLTDPANEQLGKLGIDLVSHEIFVFGDENLGKLFGELNRLNQQMSQAQWRSIAQDNANEDEFKNETIAKLVDALDDMEVPMFMLGFRTSMPETAREELSRLKKLIDMGLQENPAMEGRFEQSRLNGSDLLVLRLDGSMIPWDKAREEEPDLAEQIDRLQEKLENRTLTVAFGVYQDYVALFMAADLEALKSLGSKDLLVDSPVMERLRKYENKKLVSIGYLSDEFAKAVSNPKQQIEQLDDMAKALIPVMDLEEDLEEELQSDAQELILDLKKMVPEPGAMVGFSFMTGNGYEGYLENWAENKSLDGSKPLDILRHVGGNPIAVLASHLTSDRADVARKWVGRVAYYLEKIVLEQQLEEQQWDMYVGFRDALMPLVKQYRQITEDHWNKAFEDGQAAFVMDAKLEPKPIWHMFMPASTKPLPMLEFAQVYALSDRKQLETSLEKYDEVKKEMLTKIKEQFAEHAEELTEVLQGPAAAVPAVIQGAQMPEPLVKEVEDGKIRYDMSLQRIGVDSALAPSMGWNSEAFVVSTSPSTAERLLTAQEIEGPLSKAKGSKLAAATCFEMSRFIEFLRPWVGYGMKLAGARANQEMVDEVAPQVDTILEIIQCYQRFYSVTMEGEESLVTHYRSDFQDLN